MDNKQLLGTIFDIDNNIRFVGLINKSGKLVEGSMREGIESIEGEIHQKRWFNQIAIRREMYEMFNKLYGKTHMAFVQREKLKQLTFYRGQNIVLVTLQPHVENNKSIEIENSISEILDSNEIA